MTFREGEDMIEGFVLIAFEERGLWLEGIQVGSDRV